MRLGLLFVCVLPHLYVTAVATRGDGPWGFLLGLLAWNLAPVFIGGAMLYSRFNRQGLGWLLATLVASLTAVWLGLVAPRGSTAALIFLFMPLWNLLFVGPAGALIATFAKRRGSAKPDGD
jgi:hypothetical protein